LREQPIFVKLMLTARSIPCTLNKRAEGPAKDGTYRGNGRMNVSLRFACSILVIACFTTVIHAGEVTVDISSVANEPWTFTGPNDFLIINGSTFPTGLQNFGGVPFSIPAGPDNYWAGEAAANFGSGTVSLTVPVGVFGVTSVFTLLNSMWGWAGPNAYLYITFSGSNGAIATVPLVGNVSVRDYNNDGNTNTINNISTVQAWDNGMGQRLDRQEFVLPAALPPKRSNPLR
jgi:hypothetical protein